MPYQQIANHITAAIREARKAKGLSQRALGDLVGVPQSHISKIENGAVDLQLSSLVQLARALDLELKLIPRRALSTVEGVIKMTPGFPRVRTSAALAEISKAMRIAERVGHQIEPGIEGDAVERLVDSLVALQGLRYDTDSYVRLRNALNDWPKTAKAMLAKDASGDAPKEHHEAIDRLAATIRQLKNLRNTLVHYPVAPEERPRAAYHLDEDGDG